MIREVLGKVEDMELRMILEKRHLLNLPMHRIAMETCGNERWTTVLYKRGLRIVRQIMQEREKTEKQM